MPDLQRAPVQDAPEQDTSTDSASGGILGSLGSMMGMQNVLGNSAVVGMLPSIALGGQEGGGGLGGLINDGLGWLGNKASEGASWLGDKANQAGEWASNTWNSAREGATGLYDGASEWLGNKIDGVKQFGSDIYNGISQEGLSGILDPVGMMDRQQAQRDLADRFDVVGDDFVGPRLPNQVTQSEYRQICSTYSDIRLGRGDLTIDASQYTDPTAQQNYRNGAMNDIASMLQTQSGRAIINQLHDNHPQNDANGDPIHRHTTMVPLLKADGTVDNTNGYAAPDGGGSMRSVNPDGTLGAAGSGTDVHIRYNPGVNLGDTFPNLTASNPWLTTMRSDVLLAHEMNHAINQTAGTGDPTAVQATDNAANATDPNMAFDSAYRDRNGNPLRRIEHQAVGIGQYAGGGMTENAYRAERRLMGDTGAKGTRAGDTTMQQRTNYVLYPAPAAPAPAPGAPPTTSSPAIIGDDPNGD